MDLKAILILQVENCPLNVANEVRSWYNEVLRIFEIFSVFLEILSALSYTRSNLQ